MYLLISISMLIIGYIWIADEVRKFDEYAENERTRYIDSRKSLIRKETRNAVQYIEYMRSQAEKRLKESLKERVYEAFRTADHIYRENVETRPREEPG